MGGGSTLGTEAIRDDRIVRGSSLGSPTEVGKPCIQNGFGSGSRIWFGVEGVGLLAKFQGKP